MRLRARRDVVPVDVTWSVAGPRSTTADTVAIVTLRDRRRLPVSGARLRVEAQMSHPGMAPIVAALEERGAGSYQAALRFSMAGDWVLVATGSLPDGRRLTSRFDVGDVKDSRPR